MIKFLIKHPETGRMLFGSVLTKLNMQYLMKGHPMYLSAEDLGLEKIEFNDIMIMYYETNEEAIEDLKKHGYIDDDHIIDKPKSTAH